MDTRFGFLFPFLHEHWKQASPSFKRASKLAWRLLQGREMKTDPWFSIQQLISQPIWNSILKLTPRIAKSSFPNFGDESVIDPIAWAVAKSLTDSIHQFENLAIYENSQT